MGKDEEVDFTFFADRTFLQWHFFSSQISLKHFDRKTFPPTVTLHLTTHPNLTFIGALKVNLSERSPLSKTRLCNTQINQQNNNKKHSNINTKQTKTPLQSFFVFHFSHKHINSTSFHLSLHAYGNTQIRLYLIVNFIRLWEFVFRESFLLPAWKRGFDERLNVNLM